jgi:predicted nuclease with RNAse H fold/dephospho-CoA kinase
LADPARVIFLDVETTGLSWFYDELTIVGWSVDGKYQFFVSGGDAAPLLEALRAAYAMITFNGTMFDVRFLKKTFGELSLPDTHIDLRFLSRRVGLSGGQKAIERTLGIEARDGVEGVDGAAAVLLWHQYLRGDNQALVRLIDYNRRDVYGMCGILDEVMDRIDVCPDLLFQRPRFGERGRGILAEQIPNVSRRVDAEHRAKSRFEEIFRGTPAEHATVVGIDLTSSATRPSGWCVLKGRNAETSTISTDDEILQSVAASRPALVSIDSPLSIPSGRIRVEDDDPGRHQFGIMRRCERELKRRGINVYPCLLPSMQNLTRRGMHLANRLRSLGFPVIESYPGAAQDIIGIPRKGAGIELLKQGLADFGIRGRFQTEDVVHDELDAITSALVGSFFLSGLYEPLRGPSEGALIIPAMIAGRHSGMVVGISGRICAGKTTSARILERHGFAYTRFSLVIDDEIVARGEQVDRVSRQRVGHDIHTTKGQRWLCEKVLERVAGKEVIVIDGLRFPEDHAFFSETFGSSFFHLHIQASEALRATRYRTTAGDGPAFEVVDRQPVEAKIDGLGALATANMHNEMTIAELENNVLKWVKSLPQGPDRQCLFPS